ncbi:hypothetical protein ABMA28_009781 [Loxostege sticticalis]|uniref:Beta-N-acetylhexosaminidase n=1 Tax=Loxostege sticticalis TaxID=481309 RepID=A0ABD0SBE0_LOXSC
MRITWKISTSKIKLFTTAIMIIGFYWFLSYILLEVWFGKVEEEEEDIIKVKGPIKMNVSLNYVVMHIDLKRTPLKLSYLETLLPMLKDNGVNSLLMEYEDMFPYEGKLVNLSAENCYKKLELKRFISTAIGSGFEIIPMVQTFGHLEYALKLSEFQHLRERPLYPDSICLRKPESMAFIRHLLEQVMDFHNAIRPLKHIHIGCDDLNHVNKCHNSSEKGCLEKTDIFLHHVKSLSDVIKSQYPDTIVLIWDDMLRGIKPDKLNYFDQSTNVQPVCWEYGVLPQISLANFFEYHEKFPHIWIASAFRGADARTATFPELSSRYQNVFSWMNFILNPPKLKGEQKVYNFRGIILTGLSRHSHMDPPCELLPISIPSLLIHLIVIERFKSGVVIDGYNGFEEELLRNGRYVFINSKCVIDLERFDSSECKFDGRELYDVIKYFSRITVDLKEAFYDNERSLEYVEFYSQFDLINKNTLADNVNMLHKYLEEIGFFENKCASIMSKYYERDFINEYISHKTLHLKKKIQRLLNIYKMYYNVSVWRRTPINNTYFVT